MKLETRAVLRLKFRRGMVTRRICSPRVKDTQMLSVGVARQSGNTDFRAFDVHGGRTLVVEFYADHLLGRSSSVRGVVESRSGRHSLLGIGRLLLPVALLVQRVVRGL